MAEQQYTIEEIGARIRSKNPDAYTAFTDAQIGQRVADKNPQVKALVKKTEPTKKEDGFIKRTAREFGTTIARPGVTLGNLLAATGKAFQGDKEGADAALIRPANIAGLGSVNPYRYTDTAGVGSKENLKDIGANIIGPGLDIGSTLAGGAGTIGVGKQTLKGLVKEGAKTGAKTGAYSSGLAGIARGYEEGGLKGALVQGVTGVLGGGLIGGTAGALFPLVGKGIGKIVKRGEQKMPILESKTGKVDLDESQKILTETNLQAPKVSIKEKLAGLRQDIKSRIQGKSQKLQAYFNVAHARNASDTVPTPYEFGARHVQEAEDLLNKKLNDTGTDIGKFRRKINTIKAPQEQINNVLNNFDKELDRLNLRVDSKGDLIQKTGRPTSVTQGELNLLKILRDNLRKLKADPKASNIIENRILFDKKINFAKSAKEASNVIDPISRKTRSDLAELNRSVIGKEQSGVMKEYENVINAVEDLNNFTRRKTGAEYLIKLVLSGRGRKAKEVIETVAKHTGIDLMDDATMAQIATDIIGNTAQKNLFRQEITKAGLDLNAFLTGDKFSTVKTLLEFGAKKIADPEKVFLNAAKQSKKIFPLGK